MNAIYYTTGLAREDEQLMVIMQDGRRCYIAELRDNNEVLERRLIPADTEPGIIRKFLTDWGREHYEIVSRVVADMRGRN